MLQLYSPCNKLEDFLIATLTEFNSCYKNVVYWYTNESIQILCYN